MIICIIPARGGSKGIPRKNLAPLMGIPLVGHSIRHARRTEAIGRVFVSTDDDEIAAVAEAWGAEVIRRPAELSGDLSSSEAALVHVLDHCTAREGLDPQLVVFLQATSPLRDDGDIERAIETLRREDADSLFSARVVHGFAWRQGPAQLKPVNYDPLRRPMRQQIEESVLEENGSIYIFKPWVLREHGSRLGGRIAVYVQDPLRSFQVDEPDDLDMLRRLAPLALGMAAPLELNAIRILALDFDGVMTDNRVIVGEDGVESVLCHRGDGWGIARLVEAGVQVVVVSTEVNPVVAARCRKLGIECIHGVTDKLAALKEWVSARGAHAEQVAYVGNDVNDKDCLGWVGAPIVVADASGEARRLARYVTTLRGGDGAVREVADWLLAARKAARRPS